jgi:hypothetical protein
LLKKRPDALPDSPLDLGIGVHEYRIQTPRQLPPHRGFAHARHADKKIPLLHPPAFKSMCSEK